MLYLLIGRAIVVHREADDSKSSLRATPDHESLWV